MAAFRLHSMAELARELTFTPRSTRLQQLNAAEELLHSIQPSKGYPLDYVIFRITGYHPRQVADGLLTGMALQHDLGLLIERISRGLNLTVAGASQPVLDIDSVARQFNVTAKTIQRWRRKGLAARIFVFADGKSRVGFTLGSVEHFITQHREAAVQVCAAAPSDQQLSAMRRQAERLTGSGWWPAEIARRVGKHFGRSPLAVKQLLQLGDAEACERLRETGRGFGAMHNGRGLFAKARAAGIIAAMLYRLAMLERVNRLWWRKRHFFDDPLYHQPQAEALLKQLDEPGLHEAQGAPPLPRDLRSAWPELAQLCATPPASATQERAWFLLYNYYRYRFYTLRAKLDPQTVRRRALDNLQTLWHQAQRMKDRILRSNLRLVVFVARKHLRPGVDLMELVSEGSLILMRAVEGFDVHRGHRFSTYATLALMKGFARQAPRLEKSHGGGDGAASERIDRSQQRDWQRRLDKEQVTCWLGQLEPPERRVLAGRFGMNQHTPMTLAQLGEELGLSVSRVREVERAALGKLRRWSHAAAH